MKRLLFVCSVGHCLTAWTSVSPTDALSARQNAMQQMQAFKPETSIPSFTENPTESRITVAEDDNKTLSAVGATRVGEDSTAGFIATQEKIRQKAYPNAHSQSLDYAERLLENSDAILNESCHMEPQPCEESTIEKSCEEQTHYSEQSCGDTLSLSINTHHHAEIARIVIAPALTFNLIECEPKHDLFCNSKNVIRLHEHCEQLDVTVTFKGSPVSLLKKPTCTDPSLVLNYPSSSQLLRVTITTDEKISEEHWVREDCNKLNSGCLPNKLNQCMDANVAKIINGVSITRPCWGIQSTYQCVVGKTSSCQSLIDDGCSLSKTTCESPVENDCDVRQAVYQCTTKTCPPDKKICFAATPCASGECDATVHEESDDVNEGIARLGTLAGTADEVSKNQATPGSPSIFKGSYQECEEYLFGLRDCCTDSGFLDGIINCPSDLQTLQRAKLEHRVVYLGHYKPDLISATHYGYCVFPTKLAGILQIQGRYTQLGIGFGTATEPNCRGLTPEELARLDFKRLDISELVQEVTAKKTLPQNEALENVGINQVGGLYQKGVPHD